MGSRQELHTSQVRGRREPGPSSVAGIKSTLERNFVEEAWARKKQQDLESHWVLTEH